MISTKPVMLMTHGGPGMTSDYLAPLAESLSTLCDVRRYDQGDRGVHYSELVDEFRAELDAIGPRPVVVFAHSGGACLPLSSLDHLQSSPNVRGLVLSNWVADIAWLEEFLVNYPGVAEEAAAQAAERFPDDAEKRLREEMVILTPYYFPEANVEAGRHFMGGLSYRPAVNAGAWEEFSTLQLAGRVADITLPFLSIAGADDRMVSPTYIQRREREGNPQAVVMPGCGHFPFVDAPCLFSDIVGKFIADVAL